MRDILLVAGGLALGYYLRDSHNAELRKMLNKANADAKMHNNEGIKHWGMGHFDEALKHFKEASKIDGSSGEIHFNEAISYDKLGQHGVATKHFAVAKKKASGKNKEKLLKSKILNGHLGH